MNREDVIFWIREVAKQIAEDAENIIGENIETVMDGIKISFVIDTKCLPTYTVQREHFVLNAMAVNNE